MPPARIVIAGTGRSGTTFLVRFLAACQVPTGDLDELAYFPTARAGLERNLLDAPGDYLVKDPWLFDYLRHVDLSVTKIDTVIIPVRDLRHAAMSRIRQERIQRMKQGMATDRTTYGGAPGGAIYSMSVQDQERVLAVGQSRLIDWCLDNSIPFVLVRFPRLIHDADYLVDTLWPILARHCSRERAVEAFGEVADPQASIADRGDIEADPERADWLVQLDAATTGMDGLREQILDRDVRIAALEASKATAEQTVQSQAMTISTLREIISDLSERVESAEPSPPRRRRSVRSLAGGRWRSRTGN